MAQFQTAFDYTMKDEGGYSDRPVDRGGPTKYGITVMTLSEWRATPCDADDVKNLTKEEAQAIYLADYWNHILLGQINSQGVATAMFDICVNIGQTHCVKFAQSSAGCVVDGVIGPATVAAINKTDPKQFLFAFESHAEDYYRQIVANNPNQEPNLKGWLTRADRLLALEV